MTLIWDDDTLDPPEQPDELPPLEPEEPPVIQSMEQLLEYLGVDTVNQ